MTEAGVESAGNVTGRTFTGRRVLIAILAMLAMFAAPAVASAADGLSNVNTNNTQINGQTVAFGNVAQANLGSTTRTIYLWSNSASGGFLNLSTRTITANINLGSSYERSGGNCGGATGSSSFSATFAYQGGASFRSCQIIIRLKTGEATGTKNQSMSYSGAASGSASLTGTVTAENGAITRVTGPGNETGSFDFGEVAVGDMSTRTFTIRNTGTVDVANFARSFSGPSSAFSIVGGNCGASLPVLSSCTVDVRFQPTVAAAESKSLDFTSTSHSTNSMALSGTGVPATAILNVTPATWDFGTAPVGFPVTKLFTASNDGNSTLTLDFQHDGGTDPAVFPLAGGQTTCGATLGVGNSCVYAVQFSPDASGPAIQSGDVTITGTSPLVIDPSVNSVSLTGERVPVSTGIQIRDTAGTSVKASHNFGSVPIDTNSSYTFTLRNTGNIPISGLNVALGGAEAGSYSIQSNNCPSTLPRETNCQITVRFNTSRTGLKPARLIVTPAPASPQAAPAIVNLSGVGAGIKITNNQDENLTGVTQKRWLDTLTLAPGGSIPSDNIKVTFEVDIAPDKDIAGVEIAGSTTTNDTAPGSGYQNIADLFSGRVEIERKEGSSQALVRAEVPLSSTSMGTGNGQYGFSNGTVLVVCLGGGDYKTDDRRVWFRVRDEDGALTPAVGSRVRFSNQNYSCPDTQGPQLISSRILTVDGVNQPGGTGYARVEKNDPVTFQFNTRAKTTLDILSQETTAHPVEAVNWRIRNARTGAMFRIVNGNYVQCGAPCADESNYTQGAKYTFPTSAQGTQQLPITAPPSRGRWIVEASPQSSSGNEDDAHFWNLGVLRINDYSGTSPDLSFGGTLGARPDSNADYTISAITTDPADPVNALDSEGGRAQVIEWDLDGITDNGPLGDGFEIRYETDSATNLPADYFTQDFSTVGKTPGPFTIRARVTDNGSFLASETLAQSRIFEYTTTINSLPVAQSETVYIEADDTQPFDVDFNATDADSDPYQVDITPAGTNDGSLGGNLNGPVGDNTKPYSWPATYTGTDTFDFIPTDDKNGTGPGGTLTVRVRPNTTIDTSTISGTLFNPDASNPATRFLGSTTTTSAAFDFSSPQTPVVSYECRHLVDGDVLEDWDECSDQSTGDISYSDLGDGLHRLEVRAINDEGVEDGTPAFRTWRVDNTSPETEVRVGPQSNLPNQQPRLTNDTTPSYNFRATADERSLQEYITYECRVLFGPEDGIWQACGAPADTQGSAQVDIVGPTPDFGLTDPLDEGTYEIEVRATDEVGNLGPAMLETFTVDVSPPETALASGAEGLVNTRNLEYVLSSSEGQSTFLCMVEGQNEGVVVPMGPCPGPAADGSRPTFTVPADDHYTLTAIAVDPATNPDPTPLEVEFEVDATEPTTTMDPEVDYGNGPTLLRRTQSRKVDVTFTGNDTRQLQGFQCRLDSTDDEAWQLCQSVQRFGGLSDGDHKLEIRAKDQANNFDSTPEILEWTVDLTPPVSTITVSPDAVTNDDEPTFEFTTNEAVGSSECRLDGGTAVACTSPVTIAELGASGPLADGDHSFSVKSTDIAGNVEATVATFSWKQDTIVPEVVFNSKPGTLTDLGGGNFGWISALGAVDFGWVVKDGNPLTETPEADAECAFDPVDPDNIDGAEWTSCDRDLTIAEADNANGPHTFSVRATDPAGNVSPVTTHEWEVLGAKPVPPVIDDSSPADGVTTRVGTAYVAFSHPLEGSGLLDTLLCSLDDGPSTPCESNFSVEGLSDGDHELSIVARDVVGNLSDPTVLSWSVQSNAPVTTIDQGPNGVTKQKNATVAFSSNKAGTFECKVDGGAWDVCASPLELSDLAEGQHSVAVRAVSTVAPVGVKDPTPPSRTWTVDSIAPEVSIDSAPSGAVVSYSASLTFSSPDADATFQCKVNEGLWDACTSPLQLTGLSAGENTVLVRAVDAAGNATAEPASTTWTVEDPVCADGFEGTPPNCTAIPPVDGPGIKASLTSGSLTLASLGSVDLPVDQLVMSGKRSSDGRWYVPKEEVVFAPVEQVIEDVLGPGTVVGVEISISATGDGYGRLPSGGGASKFVLPVRADVKARLGELSLLPEGTECALKPMRFDLAGTYDEAGKSVTLSSPSVAFPQVTGCDTFKPTIDSLLELPRNDIEIAMTLGLEDIVENCPAGQTGTPPDCVEPPTPIAALAKPVVKGSKVVKPGKKGTLRVSLRNTGTGEATGVKLCFTGPKKLVKPAKRCRTVGNLGAGATGKAVLSYKVKKTAKANKPIRLKVTATATNVAKPVTAKYKAKTGKTGRAKK